LKIATIISLIADSDFLLFDRHRKFPSPQFSRCFVNSIRRNKFHF